MVDLVNDVLRKRKATSPVGWESFAHHLRHLNTPMEFIGNQDRRDYMLTSGRPRSEIFHSRDLSASKRTVRIGSPVRSGFAACVACRMRRDAVTWQYTKIRVSTMY